MVVFWGEKGPSRRVLSDSESNKGRVLRKRIKGFGRYTWPWGLLCCFLLNQEGGKGWIWVSVGWWSE